MTTAPMPATPAPDGDGAQAGRSVDAFDLEIVQFFVTWAPYGGPPQDECVPRFGMPADRLLVRLCEIVHYGGRAHLGADQLTLLARAAALPALAGVEMRPAGEVVAEIGKPTLQRGVWRWV